MKKAIFFSSALVIFTLLVLFSSGLAIEETFPTRPITMINPLPPGGNTDLLCRLLADSAGKILGQTVVVINKPGGQFLIAATTVQTAKPDGYTVGYLTPTSIFMLPHLEKTPYDPIKDFKPIIQFAAMNFGVVVNADAPYKNWKDLMEVGKTKKLRFGHSGPNSVNGIVPNMLAKKGGVSFINIPYKGAPEYQTALIGGHLDLAAGDFSYSLIEAGKIRVILMFSDTRTPMYPDIQCLKEAGFEYSVPLPFILFAPKDTPEMIVKKLEDAFTQATNDPIYHKGVAEMRLLPTYRSSPEAAQFLKESFDSYRKMLEEAGLKK